MARIIARVCPSFTPKAVHVRTLCWFLRCRSRKMFQHHRSCKTHSQLRCKLTFANMDNSVVCGIVEFEVGCPPCIFECIPGYTPTALTIECVGKDTYNPPTLPSCTIQLCKPKSQHKPALPSMQYRIWIVVQHLSWDHGMWKPHAHLGVKLDTRQVRKL